MCAKDRVKCVKDLLLHALIWFDGSYREDLKVTFETLHFIFFPLFFPFSWSALVGFFRLAGSFRSTMCTCHQHCISHVESLKIRSSLASSLLLCFPLILFTWTVCLALYIALTISFFLSLQLVCQKVSRDFGCVRVMLVSNTSRKIFPLV